MRSLDILQRLTKQAVDRERQELQAIDAEIADVERDIDTRRRKIEREASGAPDFMTSGATLQAYIMAANATIRELEGRLIQLREAHDAQLVRVRAERVEEKRCERLTERRRAQATLEATTKDQKTIDELVVMGAGRHSRGRQPKTSIRTRAPGSLSGRRARPKS